MRRAPRLIPRSPVSLSLCDEVPRITIQKSHQRAKESFVSSEKGLLRQYLPRDDIARQLEQVLGTGADTESETDLGANVISAPIRNRRPKPNSFVCPVV
jgi:hypothetical protein